MSARTKVFGMDLGVDPKIIILALIVLAGLVYFFTSSSESSSGSSSQAATVQTASRPASAPALPLRTTRRAAPRVDRDTLKLIAVDGSRGDIDPTLHLRLLERVRNVPPAAGLRNLFDAGGAVIAPPSSFPVLLKHPPTIPVGPLPGQSSAPQPPPPPPPFTIPLKYYGFAKSKGRAIDGNRGLFLDGDSILIGGEGDLLEKRFLIVALTPTSARLEDTQAKQGQDLQVTPEAPPAQ